MAPSFARLGDYCRERGATLFVRMGISPVQPITERRTKGHDKARGPHDDEEYAEDCGEFGGGQ